MSKSKTPFTDAYLRRRFPPELCEAANRFSRAAELLGARVLGIPADPQAEREFAEWLLKQRGVEAPSEQ